MIEIEWDGMEVGRRQRRQLRTRLPELSRAVDPHGNARLTVDIVARLDAYHVSITARDADHAVHAEAHDGELGLAIQRAIDLAIARWTATREAIAA